MKQQHLSDNFITINDNKKRFSRGLYAKCKGGERELAYRETEKESLWEAEHRRKRELESVQRSSYLHKHREEMQSNKKDKLCRKGYRCHNHNGASVLLITTLGSDAKSHISYNSNKWRALKWVTRWLFLRRVASDVETASTGCRSSWSGGKVIKLFKAVSYAFS